MTVLVCGSRSWTDLEAIRWRLASLPADSVVIHGGAPGADTLAGQAAAWLGLGVRVFHAEWDRYGKRAGVIRNLAMLDTEPALVLGFWNGRSAGTKHTIYEARRRGIPTEVISSDAFTSSSAAPEKVVP